MEHISYEKKETVERFVGTFISRGAYSPMEIPITHMCSVCGFTFTEDDDAVGYINVKNRQLQFRVLMNARFCPICGSRFEDERLFPDVVDELPEVWDEEYGEWKEEFKELKTEEVEDECFRELIGAELYDQTIRQPVFNIDMG